MGFLLKQLERRDSLVNPSQYIVDFFSGSFFGGGMSTAGIHVNEKNCDALVSCGACIERISKTIATFPLDLYKRGQDDGRDKAKNHPLYNILRNNPNPLMTAATWRRIQMQDMLKYGVCYSEIVFNSLTGDVEALYHIPAANVTPELTPSGKIQFRVYQTNGGPQRIILDDRMFRVFYYTDDGITPKSPIRLYADSVGLGMVLDQYASKFFSSGANPSGILSHPARLSDQAADRLKKRWKETYGGVSNAHETMVLEEGLRYDRISIPPNEAQFLESRKWQLEEICRIYDMPLDRVQSSQGSNTYSNNEQKNLEFLKFTILPHAINWEQAVSKYLLSTSESKRYYAEFNFDNLLRADSETRAKVYHIYRQDGILNANEIRKMENWSPQDGDDGDIYLCNASFVPVGQIEDFVSSKISSKGSDSVDGEGKVRDESTGERPKEDGSDKAKGKNSV